MPKAFSDNTKLIQNPWIGNESSHCRYPEKQLTLSLIQLQACLTFNGSDALLSIRVRVQTVNVCLTTGLRGLHTDFVNNTLTVAGSWICSWKNKMQTLLKVH